MFSETLYHLRDLNGISQSRFANEIGFSQAAISAWENNTREPGIEALLRIAQYFNVSVDYLVKGTSNYCQQKTNSPAETISAEDKTLLDYFHNLSRAEKAQVTEYTRYLSERGENIRKNKNA